VRGEPLYDVGFEWAESLKGQANGWVRLWGPEGDYRLRADVNADAGKVKIRGELPDEGVTRIALSSARLELDELVGGAPDVVANGTVELSSDSADEDVLGVAIETDGFQYESFYIPPFVAKLRAREEGLDIDSVVADYAGGDLYLDGKVAYEGVTQIHARGEIPNVSDDPNFAQFVSGLEGDAEFIWDAVERAGKKSILLKYPASHPPTMSESGGVQICGCHVRPCAHQIDGARLSAPGAKRPSRPRHSTLGCR